MDSGLSLKAPGFRSFNRKKELTSIVCPCVNGVTSSHVWPVKSRVLLVVWNFKIIFIVFVRGDSVVTQCRQYHSAQ